MDSTYFDIMLPGRAILRVWVRPGPGWKTAVGLQVSRASAVVRGAARFLFYVRLEFCFGLSVFSLLSCCA